MDKEQKVYIHVSTEDFSSTDLEKIELTSMDSSSKIKSYPKYCFNVLISLIIFLLIALPIIFFLPYLSKISNVFVREMSEDNRHFSIDQNYERIDAKDQNYTYIPIVGTDDIHGNFFPKINIINMGNSSLTYKTGGLEYIAKYINILREEFGSNRVLYFDAGDYFQGGYASVLYDGEIMQDYFNLVGLNGSTIGNHEFDYPKDWIEYKFNKANYKVLINNIMDNTTRKRKGLLGKNHETSHLYNIKLDNGDSIKIGVIGLSFNMKNDKNIPNTWGNKETWDKINFYSYIDGLEKEANNLRKKGADAIIALTHFGLVFNQTEAMKLDLYNKSSIQSPCIKDDEDSVLYKLLDVLKPGIIDGIIGGDSHMEMHHFENGIPMMSVPKLGKYLNIMYLPFKKGKNGKYQLVNDKIKIEGPLPACEKIFSNYHNCELISAKEALEAGELINYSWRGKKIEKDPVVEPIYDKYYEKYKKIAEKEIVTFKGFDKIKVDKSGDSILGNTYLDAIADISKSDFAIINRGIFPEALVPSTLTREDFYNQMPYLDKICTVEITGDELKKIVSTVQTVGKNFYPSSNLRQTIQMDTNGNKLMKKIELYVNGKIQPIEDDKTYKMASSKFVLSETSGEDFAKGASFEIIHDKVINNKVSCSEMTIDEEMAKYFEGKGVIDLSNKLRKEYPRIIIE